MKTKHINKRRVENELLLGRDKNNYVYYLEVPKVSSWHYDREFTGEWRVNSYNYVRRENTSSSVFTYEDYILGDKNISFNGDNKYTYHINEVLTQTTLRDGEAWLLSDRIKSYNTVLNCAKYLNAGNSHLTSSGDRDKYYDLDLCDQLLAKLEPLKESIISILSPTEDK